MYSYRKKCRKLYVGDQVTYNNINYYVIKDSDATESTVTMLKAEPLSYEEVQTYSNGTGAQTYDRNGYGGMQYHSESSVYSTSYVKTTVDAWKTAQAPAASEARLILQDEIEIESKEVKPCGSCEIEIRQLPKYEWIYNRNYTYWTNSLSGDSGIIVVEEYGEFKNASVALINPVVRPVIILDKSVLPTE